jgi:hypothetical protein
MLGDVLPQPFEAGGDLRRPFTCGRANQDFKGANVFQERVVRPAQRFRG